MMSGLLQVVGVPIGNLGDISGRAREALAQASVIACEDTRRTGQLLHLLAIKGPRLVSYHGHNERARVEEILARLRAGDTVVLVSDSGMPGISDPGAILVAAARGAGVRVEVIAGPCAAVLAFAGSGFEGNFAFGGFPPRKGKERRAWLAEFGSFKGAVVAYESPYRVKDLVADCLAAWGNRRAYVVRELSKMHEEWLGRNLEEIGAALALRDGVKGECVLVVQGELPMPKAEKAKVDKAKW